tara:strand:+ start:314 stop:688 length:375 start_codon:yes stop_codon:yes gene_type:complete
MNKIEIYTNETCPYCVQVKELLKKENIKFTEKLTSENTEEYQQIVNLTGIPTVPNVKYKNEYFIPGRDFQSPDQLLNIIKNYKKSNYSQAKITLERIKTLNYNINNAFNRLDQVLRQIDGKIKE